MSPDAENMTILKSTRMVGPASGVSSPVHSAAVKQKMIMYVADSIQHVTQHQRPSSNHRLGGCGYTVAWAVCSPAARVTPPLRHGDFSLGTLPISHRSTCVEGLGLGFRVRLES